MKSNKNRYKRIKERFIVGASSGIMAGMIFIGSANTAWAERVERPTTSYSQTSSSMHGMRKWNSKSKINALATNLGLSQDYISEELNSGKNLKQILQENGIDTTKLTRAFDGNKNKSWKKYDIRG